MIKEVEKLSKYKDLEIEVAKMWELKTTTVPVVVGALGLIKKDLERHVNKIPGNREREREREREGEREGQWGWGCKII